MHFFWLSSSTDPGNKATEQRQYGGDGIRAPTTHMVN